VGKAGILAAAGAGAEGRGGPEERGLRWGIVRGVAARSSSACGSSVRESSVVWFQIGQGRLDVVRDWRRTAFDGLEVSLPVARSCLHHPNPLSLCWEKNGDRSFD